MEGLEGHYARAASFRLPQQEAQDRNTAFPHYKMIIYIRVYNKKYDDFTKQHAV